MEKRPVIKYVCTNNIKQMIEVLLGPGFFQIDNDATFGFGASSRRHGASILVGDDQSDGNPATFRRNSMYPTNVSIPERLTHRGG